AVNGLWRPPSSRTQKETTVAILVDAAVQEECPSSHPGQLSRQAPGVAPTCRLFRRIPGQLGYARARLKRGGARQRTVWSNRAAMITFEADLGGRLRDLLASYVSDGEPGVALGLFRAGQLVIDTSAVLAVLKR